MSHSKDISLFCHSCGCDLKPGRGNFYVVRIEAFADPTPPDLRAEELWGDMDIGEEIDRLIDQMKEFTAQELMDQVYRRLTLHLCHSCYRRWIENPAGT